MSSPMDALSALLSQTETFAKNQPEYKTQSAPWSKHAELNPTLVVQPTTLDRMSAVIKHLYTNPSIDFAIRNTGTNSVSARDVILSTHGFKDFSVSDGTENDGTKVVTIGSGLDWGGVDRLMEQNAPGYAVVGARCPWVGVAGSSLIGGLSWLSHEFGIISDPQNLLDMQVVLRDGRVVWASEEGEGELLWALRGGGGNFGVVTALKLRARPYPTKIFSGVIALPYTSLAACSAGVAAMAAKPTDPKVAMHVVNQGPGMGMPDQGSKPGIAMMMYDANGEAHARSEGFKWAFDLPGAVEAVPGGEMSLRQIHGLAETFRDYEGTNLFWLCAPLIEEVDDETVVRAWKWYEECIDACAGFGIGSTVLFEFMQEPAMNSSGSREATAWPHSGHKHVMQLVLGCRPEDAPSGIRDLVMKRFQVGSVDIAGPGKATGEFHAGFLHDWHNLREVYGGNFDKLLEVKKKYDPENRFNKSVQLAE